MTLAVTAALRAMKVVDGADGTAQTDCTAEREDLTFRDLPDPPAPDPPGATATPSVPPGPRG
jgi:solute:Na+ symporter, SSS family